MFKIGFIGVGVMGRHMVNNLLKNNFDVSLYARNKYKIQDYIDKGIKCYDSIKELALNCNLIISIVGYPTDVKEVSDEILKYTNKNTYYLDMTTSSPSLANDIYQKGKIKNIYCLDAPVTGGDLGALKGTLSIFVGGDQNSYNKVLPILKSMGEKIIYLGHAGNGQKAKLANQIAIAANLVGTAELIAFSKNQNLDTNNLLEVINAGSAGSWQLKNNGVKMLIDDYNPGFFIKHLTKDLKLALDEAKNLNLDLPILKKCYEIFKQLEDEDYGNLGTQAINLYYNKKRG